MEQSRNHLRMSSAMFPKQKPRFLPEINDKRPGQASLQRTEMAKSNQGSIAMESTQRTTRFQSSLHQNICVSVLQEGFHHSFKEIFSLLQRNRADRLAAAQNNMPVPSCSLENQAHKLDMLKLHLTRAEAAQRADQYVEVYESYLALARFFSEPDDTWLRHHFYECSLTAAQKINTDSKRSEAEANENLAHLYLERGNLEMAQHHFEVFHQLATGQSWQDEDGHTYLSRACANLSKVYTLLSQTLMQCEEYHKAIQFLSRAQVLAKEACQKKLEADAAYTLGLIYHGLENHTMAQQFLNLCMEMSEPEDVENLSKAYKVIAASLESEGKTSHAIEYLQKYLELSQNHLQENVPDAYMRLGTIHISMAEYERAIEYFTSVLACSSTSFPYIQKAQVYVGIARAYSMMGPYFANMEMNNAPNIFALISWKDSQKHEFLQKP